MSDSPVLNALTDPAVTALLGAAKGFAQAAMPTRMPTPFGAVLGMGGAGALEGMQAGQQLQLQQQQVRSAQLNNRLLAATMPYRIQMLGAMGAPSGVGTGAGAGAAPLGAPSVMPVGGAGGSTPSVGAGVSGGYLGGAGATAPGGIPPNASMLPTDQLRMLGYFALANGNNRAAAAIFNTIQQRAGGAGYEPLAGGGAAYVPGGPKDPRTIYQNAGAEKWAGVGPAVAQAGGAAAAEAPYEAPVTYSALGPDGVYHDYTVPRPAWASMNGGGGGSASGTLPASMYVQRVLGAENSTGNPAARNASGPGGAPTSSAAGDGQFLSGTWVPLFRQTFPQQAAGLSDNQILALRGNSQVSGALTAAYARQNAPVLQQAGIAPNASALYLAHRFGPQGAETLLRAPAGAPLSQVLPPDVLQANPSLQGQTVGQVRTNAVMRFGTAPVDFSGGAGSQPPGTIMGKPLYTPEQTGESQAYGDISKKVIEAGNNAPVGLQRLDIIQNAAGYFRPGASGDMRLEGARMMVDGLQSLGIQPPSWLVNGAVGGETIGKEGGYLAAEMTRALGSREAASVFNQVKNIQPHIEMSQGGFQVIVNSLRQGLQRDQDLATFRERWIGDPSHGGSIRGMVNAFEQQYPVQAYASRVLPYPVPKQQSALIPNVIYRNANGQSALWTGTGFKLVGGN